MNKNTKTILSIKLQRGMGSDNGATPWYTILNIGSGQQPLKIAFDTGTTHSWVTSNRCTTPACLMHRRFDVYASETFSQVTSVNMPQVINFGPWGSMAVSMGRDTISVRDCVSEDTISFIDYNIYVSQNYTGEQFKTLIWDGAIGIPSIPDLTDTSELVRLFLIDKPDDEKIMFFNYREKIIQFGMQSKDKVYKFKLKKDVLPEYKNLWFLNFDSVNVERNSNDSFIPVFNEKNMAFCIDTGSSYFKGDPKLICEIIKVITLNGRLPVFVTKPDPDFLAYPTLIFVVEGHRFIVKPQNYFEKIAEDLYVLAFHPMEGLDNILLAGSIFLEKYNPFFFFDSKMNGNAVGFAGVV